MQYVRQGSFLAAMILGVGLTLGSVAAAQGNSGKGKEVGPRKWMAPETLSKGELVEAMASKSGLSKADAKKALDGFINATSSALAQGGGGTVYCWGDNTSRSVAPPPDYLDPDDDGDGIPDLVAFGVFSVSSGGVNTVGCPAPQEVVFEAGPAFSAHENPLAQEGGWQETPQLDRAIPPSIKGVEVTSPTELLAGDGSTGGAARCEHPVKGVDDAYLIAHIAREARLPVRHAALALDACFAVIADVVNGGGIVDLEGFGRFEAVTEITAKITETRRPPLLVIDVWEHSVSLSGASEGEIEATLRHVESISKRSARTGRNPQTGKEIKIAAKNVVKFKAGADLSAKVN